MVDTSGGRCEQQHVQRFHESNDGWLDKRVMRKHTSEHMFKCEHCNARFKNKSHLARNAGVEIAGQVGGGCVLEWPPDAAHGVKKAILTLPVIE